MPLPLRPGLTPLATLDAYAAFNGHVPAAAAALQWLRSLPGLRSHLLRAPGQLGRFIFVIFFQEEQLQGALVFEDILPGPSATVISLDD